MPADKSVLKRKRNDNLIPRRKPGPKPKLPIAAPEKSGTVRKDGRALNKSLKQRVKDGELDAKVLEGQHIAGNATITDDQIIAALEYMVHEGITLVETCKKVGLSLSAVKQRIYKYPNLHALYQQARQHYLQGKVADMETIAANAVSAVDVNRARLICDNIKWEAERVVRGMYGTHVTVAGDKDNPMVVKLVASSDELIKQIRGPAETSED